METVGLHAMFASHSSRLHPSLCLPAPAPQRPSEAMPLSLAGKGVRCVPPISVLVSQVSSPTVCRRTPVPRT
eukprot:6572045-Prymnesium_polylepis.1